MDGDSLDRSATFNVGVTGHRLIRLDPTLARGLPSIIERALGSVRDGVLRLHPPCTIPQMWLHSALATGADQLAASSAHALGYQVRAVLPFAAETYRLDFAAGAERIEFGRLLAASDSVLALTCDRDGSDTGYVMAGEAIVAQSDVLLAIWDGDASANAPGGTAYVVALADRAGLPVIHIVVDRTAGRIGPVVLHTSTASEPLDTPEAYDTLLRGIIGREAS